MSNVGCRGFKYALLSQDDTKGVAYGEFVAVPGLNKIDIKPNSQSATNYGDNAPMESATALGDISVTIDLVNLPAKDQAALLGHTLAADGTMTYASTDVAPYVCVMFSGTKASGKERHAKILKIRFQEADDAYETQEQSPKFKNPQIAGKAVVRTFDHVWKRTIDEDETGATADVVSKFLASVEPAKA